MDLMPEPAPWSKLSAPCRIEASAWCSPGNSKPPTAAGSQRRRASGRTTRGAGLVHRGVPGARAEGDWRGVGGLL